MKGKKRKKEIKPRSYAEHLSERLKNPKDAAAYLNAALARSSHKHGRKGGQDVISDFENREEVNIFKY